MNIKSFLTWRTFGIVFLGFLMVLTCMMIWKIHKIDVESEGESDRYSMFVNQYKIERGSRWNKAFDELQRQRYTSVTFEQKQNSLMIQQKYIAQIGHEGQHYDEATISNVISLSHKPSQSRHFIARSQINQQLFYLPRQSARIRRLEGGYKKLQKCLQLDNVEIKQKLHYFVDKAQNFWLLSHPHNNVLMIQVYDCEQKELIKKFIHEPVYKGRKYMVNELIEVRQLDVEGEKKFFTYEIRLLTYESHEYVLRVRSCQFGDRYQIMSTELNPSYEMTSEKMPISNKDHQSSETTHPSLITYLFVDPLNKIFEQQFNYLVFSIIKDFTEEVRQLLGGLGVDTKTVNAFVRDKLKEYEREKAPEYLDYDIQLYDENNDCITNLQYHIPDANSSETANSSLTKLDKYLLTTRTPMFHSIQNYDQHDIVQILKNQKSPSMSEFKRLSIEKSYQTEYTSNYFQAVYATYPDSRIHFLGLGQKVFYLHPKENVREEDYLMIRTREGGLIMQGSKIKGVYEDRPLNKNEEVRQDYFIEGNQVLPGIYEAHTGYQSLYSVLNGSKVELINGLSGKTMLTYSINTKIGYQFAGSYLFNNQWWVVTFNTETKLTQLTKHQLYVEKSYPKQIDAVKRTYGKLEASQFSQGEDDLAALFKEYLHLTENQGIVVLDVFRCLDQFYYIQICDAKGGNYAVARIHFKKLSNRQPKTYKTYATELQERLVVQPKDMVKDKQKTDPFLLILGGRQFFEGIDVLIKQNKFSFKNYSVKNGDSETAISLMQKMNQFEFLPYVLLSRQEIQGVWTDEPKSTQEIIMLNMRVLIENGKKKFGVETKQLARTRVKYFGVFVVFILFSLIIKMAISEKLKRIREYEGKKQENKENSQQKEQKDGKSPKTKNKKEKTK